MDADLSKEIIDLIEDLNSWVEYDPDNELGNRMDKVIKKLQAESNSTTPPSAIEIRNGALEDAAQICESLSRLYPREDVGFDKGYSMGTSRAMNGIRALIKPSTES